MREQFLGRERSSKNIILSSVYPLATQARYWRADTRGLLAAARSVDLVPCRNTYIRIHMKGITLVHDTGAQASFLSSVSSFYYTMKLSAIEFRPIVLLLVVTDNIGACERDNEVFPVY
jgi:hypothetical protein